MKQRLDTLAPVDFTPWPGRAEDDRTTVPELEAYRTIVAPRLRMCLLVMHRSKSGLIETAKNMMAEPRKDAAEGTMLEAFLEDIDLALEFAAAMHDLAKAAQARMVVTVANLIREHEAGRSP